MHPEDLRKRQKFIKSTPLQDRLSEQKMPRRDGNFVAMEKVENSEFDTFFEYENELADMRPSNKQIDIVQEESGVVMMQPAISAKSVDFEERPVIPVIMRREKAAEVSPVISNVMREESSPNMPSKTGNSYTDVVGFEFVRCGYIMKNKSRCKRQAPKNSTICSIHKKIVEKNRQ